MSKLKTRTDDPLRGLKNVGPATRADLRTLTINSLADLAASDPDELYVRLQNETGTRYDPCVWDVFAAAIHQAKSGDARNWWAFTPIRKEREANGTFGLAADQLAGGKPGLM
jgi:hypothetical protein